VVVEQFQPPQNLLRAAAHERHNLMGTKKTMPVDQPDYFPVAFGELHGGNFGGTFETGKTELHRSTLLDTTQIEKASGFAPRESISSRKGVRSVSAKGRNSFP
jgi:hypothetical protein